MADHYKRTGEARSNRRHRELPSPDSREPHRSGPRSRPHYDDRRTQSSQSPPRKRRRSRSPRGRNREDSRDETIRRQSLPPSPARRSRAPLLSQKDAFQGEDAVQPLPEKQKPNFQATGRLATESNTITSIHGQAVVLKYHEPTEARKPATKDAWRMYVFKESDVIDTVELGIRSCWLFGRERAVVDYTIEHPSCSKQHAVLQFRYVEKRNEFGDRKGKVRPYVIDLESGNGTTVNGEKIPPGRYVEVRDKDVLKFGLSSREYVLMLPPPI